MTQQGKYILFYSVQCQYSKEFIKQLSNNKDLYQKFVMVNVNNPKIKLPPSIKAVPTIIVPGPYKEDIYVGPDALKWLSLIGNQSNSQGETQGAQGVPQRKVEGQMDNTIGGMAAYDPSSMAGFSDNFTLLDAPDNAMDKSYMSLNSFGGQMAPQDTTGGGQMDDPNKLKKDAASRAMEELQAQREKEIPQAISRQ